MLFRLRDSGNTNIGHGMGTGGDVGRRLHARSIDGILVYPHPLAVEVHELAWARMTCVSLGRASHRTTHHCFRAATLNTRSFSGPHRGNSLGDWAVSPLNSGPGTPNHFIKTSVSHTSKEPI